MKKRTCVPIALFLTVCLTALVNAQDLSHLYMPYGFQLPFLQKGEYLLSASFNGYNYKSTSRYINAIDSPAVAWDDRWRSSNRSLSISGVIGITDNLLAEADLRLMPSQGIGSDQSDRPGYRYDLKRKSNTVLSPAFKLVFRPKTNIECFGWFRTENSKTTYERTPISDWLIGPDNVKNRYSAFSVGISYFGKL
jgi:hypothetical protein